MYATHEVTLSIEHIPMLGGGGMNIVHLPRKRVLRGVHVRGKTHKRIPHQTIGTSFINQPLIPVATFPPTLCYVSPNRPVPRLPACRLATSRRPGRLRPRRPLARDRSTAPRSRARTRSRHWVPWSESQHRSGSIHPGICLRTTTNLIGMQHGLADELGEQGIASRTRRDRGRRGGLSDGRRRALRHCREHIFHASEVHRNSARSAGGRQGRGARGFGEGRSRDRAGQGRSRVMLP